MPEDEGPQLTTRTLVRLVVPSLAVGVASALALLGLTTVANGIEQLVWDRLPDAWGVGTTDTWWTVLVLTLTGVLVGVVVRWAPGHAGVDPATTELVAAPLPLRTLPGLAAALVLGLAGGVSLGPENPIIAINVALAAWFLCRPRLGVPVPVAVSLGMAGTIGAMFATPVAAALVLTEAFAERGDRTGHLFDRLFGPLVAAGAGAVTMEAFDAPTFAVDLPPYPGPALGDALSAAVVAVVAALLCLLAVLVFPLVHTGFHRLRSPVLALGAAGLVLGLLGVVGGPLTLFKGLQEMKELAERADTYAWYGLLAIGIVKLAALVVAAGAGFRGGRIFPAVFIGVAFGLSASSLVSAVPPTVAVSAGVLGSVLVVSRDGWLALFMAATTVGDIRLLPVLCLALVPLWLVVRRLRPLRAEAPADRPEFAALIPRG
ncbi:ion channel protein [Luteimicrobium sp. NPDC057192]|uniref:ion channel protein n=1 Tax=Luteimicrobium sp. NPDC057192 TaxID=3346042 RepID=UPI00362EB848